VRNAIFVHVLANLQQTAAATALGAYLTPNALNKVDPQIKAASKLHYVAVKNGVWKVSRMPLLSASPLAAGSTDLGSEVPPMLVEDDSDDECDHCEDSENCPCFSIPEKCTRWVVALHMSVVEVGLASMSSYHLCQKWYGTSS
jgi:hypothetical protein